MGNWGEVGKAPANIYLTLIVMGNSKFNLEGLVLSNISRKIKRVLCLLKLITVCLLLTAFSSSCVDQIELEPENTDVTEDSDLEANVFKEINNYRVSKDLGTLKYSEEIAKIARLHSDNMATGDVEFGHEGFDYRFDCVCEELDNVEGMAENVAYGYLSAKAVSEGWVGSVGHKKNIEGDFTHTGVGISKSKDGTIYFTQLFVKIKK